MPRFSIRNVLLAGIIAAASSGVAHADIALQSGDRWSPDQTVIVPGQLVLKIKDKVDNVQVGPARVMNARNFLWSSRDAEISNLSIVGVDAMDIRREGIRLDGTVDGAIISNFNIFMAARPSDKVATGINLRTGSDILLNDGEICCFRTVEDGYPRGDGVVAERAVDTLTIARVRSTDNADGGFDLKAANAVLEDLYAARNYRNFRFWGGVRAETITSEAPRDAHVWAGNGAEVVIDHLIAKSDEAKPLLRLRNARSVEIRRCTLDVPADTPTIVGEWEEGSVTLGAGCEAPA
ncbi:MAG: hypothetical protein WA906_12530 [Pacificimonas sp.]